MRRDKKSPQQLHPSFLNKSESIYSVMYCQWKYALLFSKAQTVYEFEPLLTEKVV